MAVRQQVFRLLGQPGGAQDVALPQQRAPLRVPSLIRRNKFQSPASHTYWSSAAA